MGPAARGLGALAGREIDVDALAAHELNGRQIKNCLQLALALARREGVPLQQPHLDATLELSTAFAHATGGSGAHDFGEAEGGERRSDGTRGLCHSLRAAAVRCLQ